MNRWQPRFSLRALLIATAIVGLFFGLWEATKRRGPADVKSYLDRQDLRVESEDIAVKGPLLLSAGYFGGYVGPDPLSASPSSIYWQQHYYFWFFGYVVQVR